MKRLWLGGVVLGIGVALSTQGGVVAALALAAAALAVCACLPERAVVQAYQRDWPAPVPVGVRLARQNLRPARRLRRTQRR